MHKRDESSRRIYAGTRAEKAWDRIRFSHDRHDQAIKWAMAWGYFAHRREAIEYQNIRRGYLQ